MSKLLQLRGGTTSQHNSFTGAVREVTVDTDKDTLIVHDGSTQGGFELARVASPALTGNPTAPTQSANNNSTRIATTAYTDAAIAALSDSAPSTLNTLNELAAALGDDANYATTTTNAIAAKLPLAGGTMTGNIAHAGDFTIDVGGDLLLDADGADVRMLDGGTDYLKFTKDGNNSIIKSQVSDGDLLLKGSDGGVEITAMSFDMSASGEATLNGGLKMGDNKKIKLGGAEDLEIFHDGNDSIILDTGTGNMIVKTDGNFYVQKESGNENMIRANVDGAVLLYYDNSAKYETTSGGGQVNGDLYVTGGNIGLDAGDKIGFSNNSHIDFNVNNATEMRLEADGDLHVDGDVIAYSTTISDERLKDNIEVVDGALDKVKQLKGVTFNRKQDGQESAGVIAQDVEKVLPQAVKHKALPLQTGDDGLFKTVQYDALHALLIESIKELSARVEELENK